MPEENKEQKELEKLLNEPPEGEDEANGEGNGEGEDKGKGKEGEEGTEGEEGAEPGVTKIKPEGAEEGDEGEGEGEEGGEKGKGKEGEGDEFKGKSREEVIKMLEDERKKNPKPAKPAGEGEGKEEGEEGEPAIPTAEELQKMSPSDFAKWVLARIDEGVKRTIESQSKVQGAVRAEIAEAKKEHNLGDPDYRKMVLAIIEAASAKGTVMPLKDACKQVDAFLGKHKGKGEGEDEQLSDEEKSRLKKAKAQVESGAGAPTKPEGSDAEAKRIQKALTGSGQKSPLGGLGV